MAPPLLLIAALPQQQRLLTQFQAHLQPRGLSLTAISTKQADEQLLIEAAALFVVITPASLRHPEISTLYHKALQQGKIVVPLIVRFPHVMPADLQNVQWLDCSRGSDSAWQQLLLLLETMGIARWPVPPQPIFDAELVNIRSRTGRIPPDWHLFYMARTRLYRLTGRAIRAVAILLATTIVGAILTHFALDVVSVGVVVTVVVTILLSESGHTFGQRDPLLVITPQGWLQSADGQVSAFAFAEIAQLQIVPGVRTERKQLMISFIKQPASLLFTIAPYFNNGLLASVIEAAYQRYRSHQEPLLTLPQVFISYSHHDVAFVEIFERNLRKEGYATWLDRQTLHGGTRWQSEIHQALDQVEAVIVVISPDAMRSPEVQREYTYALAQGKRVVAVLARKTATIPPALQPHVVGNSSAQAVIGQAYVVAALDQLGVHANRRPFASPLNPLLTMGQAFSGTAPQGTHLYRGKMPHIYGTVLVLLPMLLLIVGIGAVASANYDTASFVGIVTIGGLFLSPMSRRRWLALPAFVIVRPDGFAYYIPPIGVYVPMTLAFQGMAALRVENLLRATIIHYTPIGMQHISSIVLHASTFPNHRTIGAQVLTVYQQFGHPSSLANPIGTRVGTPNTPPR